MRHFRVATCLAAITAAACSQPRRELGADVFSTDTVPARFVMTVTGSLAIALRSNNFYMRPDKSLVLETPATLLIQKGEGTATIEVLDSARRVAVQPTGTPLDSTDAVAIVGRSVLMTRVGEQRVVTLKLVKK
jgi:hypothetical protein